METSPRAGLVFAVEERASFESEEFLDQFKEYDSWTKEDWDSFTKKEEENGVEGGENGLLAYFEQTKDNS